MSPEQQEIWDCGAYARLNGIPISDCPSYSNPMDTALWQSGWRTIGSKPKTAQADVRVRKQFAALLPEPE